MAATKTYEGVEAQQGGRERYAQLARNGAGLLTFTGILSIIAGILFLAIRWSVFGLSVVAGIYLIARGASSIGQSRRGGSGWLVFLGFMAMVAGLVALGWPGKTLGVLAVLMGAWLVVNGVVEIVAGFSDMSQPYWWLTLIAGLISLPLGIWALGHPKITLVAMTVVIGVWAITSGVTQIALANQLRADS